MAESEPGYKNKHPRAIHLNTYRGVACDLMELNEPIADGFMRVSDMRGEVVIIQKPQDKVRDYNEIGFVRVAKFLKLPRIDFWKNSNGLVQTRREGDIWYVAVNDQDLADKVARTESNGKKFDERFVDAFQAEVRHGLASCLRREKLLNSGKYNFGFLAAYHGILEFDLVLGAAFLAMAVADRDITSAINAVVIAAGANVVWNTFNLAGAAMTYIDQRLWGERQFIKPLTPNFNDPFVRHSLPELVMPPVPIDRIIRGSRYLEQHGNNLINHTK